MLNLCRCTQSLLPDGVSVCDTGRVKVEQRAGPLETVACCRHAPEYHSSVESDGPGSLNPGEILDERFLITERISRSGTAMIFKAQDLENENADVAVKVPHACYEREAGFLGQFWREEEIGLELDHPFIVKFIPIPGRRSRPYVVTEYVRGCTLAHLLEAMSPLPQTDTMQIGCLLCEALQYLHDHHVVHCDLKPHNVMIGCDGTLRLLDFGLAQSTTLHRSRQDGGVLAMGTPDYMAPEQVEGNRCDARTDIYCLGAMLYEMLTGRQPFEGDNLLILMNARMQGDPAPLREFNSEISPMVERMVLRCLRRRPSARPQSALALGALLQDALALVSVHRDLAPGRARFETVLRRFREAIRSSFSRS